MGTKIRSEVSKNSEYHISKHRYLELKHFCMQYNDWKKALSLMDGYHSQLDKTGSRPTEHDVENRELYFDHLRIVDLSAYETDPDLAQILILGITEEVSYDILNARSTMPVSRDYYYFAYRKFFWILDKKRR